MAYINFLYPFFLILHVLICLFLILLVLVQNDKGGGLAGAFGGMGGAAFTGASVATILTKITQATAITSFVVILILNALSVKKAGAPRVHSELKSSSLSSVLPEELGRSIQTGTGQSDLGLPVEGAPAGGSEGEE